MSTEPASGPSDRAAGEGVRSERANDRAPISLAVFAAITAGLADAFELDELAAHLDVDAADWEQARVEWTRVLAGDEDGAQFNHYKAQIADREDELTRDLDPVDRDLEAWIGFLGALEAESPGKLLAKHGLRLPDLSRLVRRWAARFEADPELEKRAADLKKRGVAASVPKLRIGESELARLSAPEGPAVAAADEVEPPPTSVPSSSFDDLSIVEYAAIVARLERRGVLLRAVLRSRDVDEALFARERERIERAMKADPELRREVATLLAHERSCLDAARATELNLVEPPMSRARPLPIEPEPASIRPVLGPSPEPAPIAGGALAGSAAEAPLGDVPLGDTGPVPGASTHAIVDEETGLVDEDCTAIALPFSARGEALPFASEPPPPPDEEPVEDSVGISLENHARLHVELNAAFDDAEVHERYGVSPEARKRADLHYDERKRAEPEVDEAWLAAYQAHAAELLEMDDPDA